jgi:hypothetical protein
MRDGWPGSNIGILDNASILTLPITACTMPRRTRPHTCVVELDWGVRRAGRIDTGHSIGTRPETGQSSPLYCPAGCLRRCVDGVGDDGYATFGPGLDAEIEKDDVPEHLSVVGCELGTTAVKADSWRQRLTKRLRGERVIGLLGSELMPIHEHGLARKNHSHEGSHEKPG